MKRGAPDRDAVRRTHLGALDLGTPHARKQASEPMEARHHYDWPGNVWGLRNSLERAAVCRTDVITGNDLPDCAFRPPAAVHSYAPLVCAAFHN
jgi:DNA-binding NtrC family response regulator